jgi:hypothetical protein
MRHDKTLRQASARLQKSFRGASAPLVRTVLRELQAALAAKDARIAVLEAALVEATQRIARFEADDPRPPAGALRGQVAAVTYPANLTAAPGEVPDDGPAPAPGARKRATKQSKPKGGVDGGQNQKGRRQA